jgi:hypothetical protein
MFESNQIFEFTNVFSNAGIVKSRYYGVWAFSASQFYRDY